MLPWPEARDSPKCLLLIRFCLKVICTKVRDGPKRIVRLKEGEPRNRHVVIVDDLVQSGGTLLECGKLLKSQVLFPACINLVSRPLCAESFLSGIQVHVKSQFQCSLHLIYRVLPTPLQCLQHHRGCSTVLWLQRLGWMSQLCNESKSHTCMGFHSLLPSYGGNSNQVSIR